MRKRKIFISYSSEDSHYHKALVKHLAGLERSGLIEHWSKDKITAGTDKDKEVKRQLEIAEIIIFLVSPDLADSYNIINIEINKAIERYKKGEVKILPILIRSFDFQSLPIRTFQALPENLNPISKWEDKDEAWLNVIEGIKKLLKTSNPKPGQNVVNEENPKPSIFNPFKISLVFKISIFIGIIALLLLSKQFNFEPSGNKVIAEKTRTTTNIEKTSVQHPVTKSPKIKAVDKKIDDNKERSKQNFDPTDSIATATPSTNVAHREVKPLLCKQKGSVKLKGTNQPATGATVMFDDEEDWVCTINEKGKFLIELPARVEGKQILLTIEYNGTIHERWKKVCNNRIDIKI